MLKRGKYIALFSLVLLCSACTTSESMKTVGSVNLERFMGKWYVIASIPTYFERNAFNALEHYALNEDGHIDTTFTFNAGGFDGERKSFQPKAFIKDKESNALWAMQFVWPFKADYRIVYLNEDYSQTIIGRQARDYVWVMARTPEIPEEEYRLLVEQVLALGYEKDKLTKVPQRWLAQED